MGRIHGDLLERTFNYSLSILELIDDLPQNNKGWVIGKQLLRSGTSIGANVREADQAYSGREFAHKCGVALKEASETQYWLELCMEAELLDRIETEPALKEAHELMKILNTIVKKTLSTITPPPKSNPTK